MGRHLRAFRGRTRPFVQPNSLVIAAAAAVALALLLFQALQHGHLDAIDEYDDGVYFGASLQLFHGILPYKDFAFIQPPMITVWLLPFAALASVAGTGAAMQVARLFVDLVAVSNVVLLGLLVRHRSRMQVAVVSGIMALSEGTVRSAQTILIEPFLVLTCLLALHCLLTDGVVTASRRRLLGCGALLGMAGATKLWAVFLLVAILIAVWPSGTSARVRLLAGAAGGFVLCSLPFLVFAPVNFLRDVFVTQAIRDGSGYTFVERLADLTGFVQLTAFVSTHGAVALVVLALILISALGLIAAAFSDIRSRSANVLDRIALSGFVLIGVSLLISPTYYYHYGGFMAPFVALTAGAVIGRFQVRIRAHDTTASSWQQRAKLTRPAAWISVSLLLGGLLSSTGDYLVSAKPAPQLADDLSDAIPAQGCVLYENPTVALLDDRFTADKKGCPDVIDWLGQERVLDNGQSATVSDTQDASLQRTIRHWLTHSDGVVVYGSNPGWGHGVKSFLSVHFSIRAGNAPNMRVYVRDPS
jgi:alpha-1,2-mannosyltransferase